MNRRHFIQHATMLPGIFTLSPNLMAKPAPMKIHFLRHATLFLEAGGVKLLIDPMLSAKDALDPVANAANSFRIPMTDLPIDENDLKEQLKTIDATIITHTHRDHWDVKAQELLSKNGTILCQPTDQEALEQKGFNRVTAVNSAMSFKGLKIFRTGGQHGTGEIGLKMGHVSGFVIESQQKKIYIAGDTIWCAEVEHALKTYNPDYVVVNAGAARFLSGDPITMDENDVIKVCRALPTAKVIAIHMDTVNHCLLKRSDLKKILERENLQHQCIIPADGEILELNP